MVENDIKNLEFQTLKLPYEMLNKKFRQTQKNIDREVMKIQASVKELEKFMEKEELEKQDEKMEVESEKKEQKEMEVDATEMCKTKTEQMRQLVETNSGKLATFTEKLMVSVKEEMTAAETCKSRLQELNKWCQHLKEVDTSSSAATLWKKKQLDKMLVEYFLRSGYYDTAEKLAKHSGIEELSNMTFFSVFRDIEEALDRKETSKCLAWCADNKSKLRKIKSTLEMSLRQQEFVEMVKQGRKMDAVMYARKHFTTMEEPQHKDIQQCMGLLIFPLDSSQSPYKHLLQPERWQDLKRIFRKESYRMYQLNEAPVLSLILQAGLSALKTPICFDSTEKYSKESMRPKKTNCPVCLPAFKTLATKLPFALSSHSHLICFGSGEPINEHNLPLMLPNGHAYGSNYLNEMAEKNEGQVTCPRTNQSFPFKDALKVYIM